MSVRDPGRKEILGGTGTEFTVIITGASVEPDLIECEQPLYRLQAICGPKDFDDPSPAITIMFPGED